MKHDLSSLLYIMLAIIFVIFICTYPIAVLFGGLIATEVSTEFYSGHDEFLWLIMMALAAIPILISMIYAWNLIDSVVQGDAFTHTNAMRLKRIAQLAALDAIFFFTGNQILLVSNLPDPFGATFFSLLLMFAGIFIALVAAVLSHLTDKQTQ